MGSAAAAVAHGRGGEGMVGATNIGRLRCAARQGKARGVVTSWHLRVFAVVVAVMGCLLLAASIVMSAVHQVQFRNGAAISRNFRGLQELKENIIRTEQAEQIMHGRLLHMATSVVTKCRTSLMVKVLHYGKNPTNKRVNGSPVLLSTVILMKDLARTTMASFWSAQMAVLTNSA